VHVTAAGAVMSRTVVLRYRGPDKPHDVAVYSLDATGQVLVKLLDPEYADLAQSALKDGVYCHDDGDKTKMVMPSEGQRFLDNLLLESSARYYSYYDPDGAKT
jgi:hypothetical protein